MKSANSYLVAAFVIAFSVLLIIPMWAFYGVLLPQEGAHAHAHGTEDKVSVSEFEEKTARFIAERQLPDGSVRAEHGEPVYVVAKQYTFLPNTIRLVAGERYEVQMLSTDVVHAFSIQMGNTSYNAVVMPNMVTAFELTPMKQGRYLVVCSEYCGLGHDFMYFSIVVEPRADARDERDAAVERHEKSGSASKGHRH
jgi:heme/copper-type cytochrome/quinol oxidase subunit 2